jgi:penicillin-binding protein 1A
LGWLFVEQRLPGAADLKTMTAMREGTLTLKSMDNAIFYQAGPASRETVTLQQMPDQLVQAFLATEDRRFYQHHGIDLQGIGRALVTNILAGSVEEGGSTLTQQLARIAFLNQEQTLTRKLREALLAIKIDATLSKQQILENYLNQVYLGEGAYGVADAAWVYFGKSIQELTLPEMAMLAGLPAAPGAYSPVADPAAAKQRRDQVLQRMERDEFITAAEAIAARQDPIQVNPQSPKRLDNLAPYFTSYIQKQLPRVIPERELKAGGLTVETTLNLKWQQAAQKAVLDTVNYDGPAQGFSQAALVAIDPRSGEIRAMVGGTDFQASQFNRVTQAQRQPGSTFKTFVYTTAIAAGFSPHDGYLDAPFNVDGYKPKNYHKEYKGWVSMADALTYSLNTVAVRTLIDVGFEPVIKTASAMGIGVKLQPFYSMALGSSEVTLLDLTTAYGTLAQQGVKTEPHGIRRVINRAGKVIYEAEVKTKKVVDPQTAAIVTWMLEDVVKDGTGTAARLNRPVAGKTGTSEESRDLWFVGYIPQLVTGVWLGNDDNYPTGGSSSTAAYTWKDFMEEVVPTLPVEKFPELPKLDGRKGSIKAQPARPNSMYNVSAAESGETTEAETASSNEEDSYYEDSTYYEETN